MSGVSIEELARETEELTRLHEEALIEREALENEMSDNAAALRDIAAKGLALAARNYAQVFDTGTDGGPATREGALHRAMRALLTAARHFASEDLRLYAAVTELDELGNGRVSLAALDEAADTLLNLAEEADDARSES